MSFDDSMKEGIDALFSVGVQQKAVGAAIEQSVVSLGTKCEVTQWANDGATLAFYPGLARRVSHKSPIVIAKVTRSLPPTGSSDGQISLNVYVNNGLSVTPRSYGIKLGPKRLLGVEVYRKFLNRLESELHAIDPGATIRRRGSKQLGE